MTSPTTVLDDLSSAPTGWLADPPPADPPPAGPPPADPPPADRPSADGWAPAWDEAAEELSEQLFAGAIAAMELATTHLGLRLGLYQGLKTLGPATSGELADHVGLDERYVREWLEQQAVARLLVCQDEQATPDARIYALPATTATVLLAAETPAYLGPLAHLAVGALLAVPEVEEAFRTGGGVPFSRYGSAVRQGLGLLNGATFDRALTSWLAALPDIDQRLRTDRSPTVLDLGCGTGRSALALARAYPAVRVHGVDLDPASIDEARAASASAGLSRRVSFAVADAASVGGETSQLYDLVTILEALHDMGDPVGALAASRRQLRDGGAVLVADQLTRDAFVADGDPLERFQYGCSVLHCLPATRAEDHVVAHGTVIRAQTVRSWARQAGFGTCRVLPIEDPFWRFYRLGGDA
jgi:SAM-dependent methyltransferase